MAEKFSSQLPASLTEGPSLGECRAFVAAVAAEPATTSNAEALALARDMIALFVRVDAADPLAYSKGVATIIEAYPPSVTRDIAHPLRGVPASLRFLPALAEVKGWLDQRMAARTAARVRAECRVLDFQRQPPPAAAEPPMTEDERNRRKAQVAELLGGLKRGR